MDSTSDSEDDGSDYSFHIVGGGVHPPPRMESSGPIEGERDADILKVWL